MLSIDTLQSQNVKVPRFLRTSILTCEFPSFPATRMWSVTPHGPNRSWPFVMEAIVAVTDTDFAMHPINPKVQSCTNRVNATCRFPPNRSPQFQVKKVAMIRQFAGKASVNLNLWHKYDLGSWSQTLNNVLSTRLFAGVLHVKKCTPLFSYSQPPPPPKKIWWCFSYDYFFHVTKFPGSAIHHTLI